MKTDNEKKVVESAEQENVQPTEAPAEEEQQITLVAESTKGIGEAGGVAWCELYGTKGGNQIKINLTSRSATPTGALINLLIAIKEAQDKYRLRPYPPQAPAPIPAPEPAPAPTQEPAPAPAPAPAPTGKPELVYEPIEEQGGVIIAKIMRVTPRSDGKTRIEFMEQGHQYGDVSAVMSPEQLAGMLSVVGAWTPEHFKSAAEYQVNYEIKWLPSKTLNRNGKPYKNIAAIKLA